MDTNKYRIHEYKGSFSVEKYLGPNPFGPDWINAIAYSPKFSSLQFAKAALDILLSDERIEELSHVYHEYP